MNLKKRLENKLEEIAEFLLYHEDNNKEIGVLTGTSGNALFHFYYANYKDNERHREKGAEIISDAFDRIEKGYNYPTFCDGIAGACWALEVLKEEEFIELEEDIITEGLDEYFFDKMNLDIEESKYDSLHGAIGYGHYFLKRYQHAISKESKKRYQGYLYILINFLKDTAIESDAGIWWKSKINIGEQSFEVCNLGLAHGISSILNFLSRLAEHSYFQENAQSLLRLAAYHILSCKHTDIELTSSFPNWTKKQNSNSHNSRLAWCYGDLGIGISLLQAGEVLFDNILREEAMQVLKKSTERRDISEAGLIDAGLCHGAYGVINIYDQVYKVTKDILYKETAEFWMPVALDICLRKLITGSPKPIY